MASVSAHTPRHHKGKLIFVGACLVLLLCAALGFVNVVLPLMATRRTVARWNAKLDGAFPGRDEVGKCVSELGGQRVAFRRLRQYLSAPSFIAPHKSMAISFLAGCGRQGFETLVQLLAHEDANVRMCAALALGKVDKEDGDVLPLLAGALRDRQHNVRDAAMASLRRVRLSLQPIEAELIAVARNGEDGILQRIEAIECIGQLEHPTKAIVPALVAAAKNPPAEVRRSAVRTIGKVCREKPDLRDLLVPELIAMTGRRDVSFYAMKALKRLGRIAAEISPRIEELIQGNDSLDKRCLAVVAYWRVTGRVQSHITLLEEALVSRDKDARRTGALAVSLVGPDARSCVPKVLKLLDEDDLSIRKNAVYALWGVGASAKPAVPRLRQLLKSEKDPEMRKTIDGALKAIIKAIDELPVGEVKASSDLEPPEMPNSPGWEEGQLTSTPVVSQNSSEHHQPAFLW